ncbi:chemotaxis protein MotC [Mesorhizobium sp. NBSH29]|uniref:chemotaxis protein MotC n=1 Tax=Mesorhizobium sp. NBSH29 TaxID=2654249 RepID=UPI00215637E3|nr:chemotaxis protein MotC [Mesorhizobium sp. NBSH29]
MVRSLQLLQDKIASGDHAALPMQTKLLEMIDGRLRQSNPQDFSDKRNFRAMLIYAMSGGNPATIEGVLRRLPPEPADRKVAEGVLNYLRGKPGEARTALNDVNPMAEVPELGAFLALVKASVATNEDAVSASRLFDQARLLGPGTLIEEAALRRSLSLAVSLSDAERFLTLSSQYVRRFLNSPYASQFADGFVDGVVTLHVTADLSAVRKIISAMEPEQQKFIYLRIARRGAIDGYTTLSAFASERIEAASQKADTEADPRAELYSSLAAITGTENGEVLTRLRGIDRERLSENDRRLLDAAQAVAFEMIAQPVAAPKALMPERVEAATVSEELSPRIPPSATHVVATSPSPPYQNAPVDAATTTAQAARAKLDAVDKLLGASAE